MEIVLVFLRLAVRSISTPAYNGNNLVNAMTVGIAQSNKIFILQLPEAVIQLFT